MNKEKAYFFPRVLAYLIDVLIVSLVVSLIVEFIPNDKLNRLNKEMNELTTNYMNQNINAEEYLNGYQDMYYDIQYANVGFSIINLVAIISYFSVYQFYNKGQTLGKRIMKIKVISNDDSELTINNFVYRSMIIDGVFVGLVDLILVLFMNKNYYFYLSFPLQIVQEIVLLVIIIMILYKKDGRGLHDKLANTKVVMCD